MCVCVQGDEDGELYNAVGTVGPVSIAYDVASDFRFYKKGVYKRLVPQALHDDSLL